MAYTMPLKKRIRVAKRRRERYRTEPEYRLRRVNLSRAQKGLPPLASVDEIASRSAEPR